MAQRLRLVPTPTYLFFYYLIQHLPASGARGVGEVHTAGGWRIGAGVARSSGRATCFSRADVDMREKNGCVSSDVPEVQEEPENIEVSLLLLLLLTTDGVFVGGRAGEDQNDDVGVVTNGEADWVDPPGKSVTSCVEKYEATLKRERGRGEGGEGCRKRRSDS